MRAAPLSQLVGQFDFALFGSLTNAPTPLRSLVDTGAEDRVGVSAEFAVVTETVVCREDVDLVVLR